MSANADSADALASLARHVRARRKALKLSQQAIDRGAGPSTTTLSQIEHERLPVWPADVTARRLETSLKWRPGSVDAIRRGGEPTPLPAPEPEPDEAEAVDHPEPVPAASRVAKSDLSTASDDALLSELAQRLRNRRLNHL